MFVTFCTVKKMWAGDYVTVIFHIVHPQTLILDRLEHTKNWPENLANTFSEALAIINLFFAGVSHFFVGDKFHLR